MPSDIATLRALGGATYLRPNVIDHTLDDNSLEDKCPLDNDKHYINPQYHLGVLDKLPLELLCNTLLKTDIRSLTDFRCVNARAMEVVNSGIPADPEKLPSLTSRSSKHRPWVEFLVRRPF
jgi:hypothetical protein